VPENNASAKLPVRGGEVVWFFEIPILGILIPKMGILEVLQHLKLGLIFLHVG
jgi:hypothetical protein